MSEFSENFENTCRELSNLVNSERQQTHGDFETFLITYTDMLRAYIGNVVVRQGREWTPEDTASILALMKAARCANGLPIPAHTLDMAGYGIAATAFSLTFRRAPEPQEGPQEAPEDVRAAQTKGNPEHPLRPCTCKAGGMFDNFDNFDNCHCPPEGPPVPRRSVLDGDPNIPGWVSTNLTETPPPADLPDGTIIYERVQGAGQVRKGVMLHGTFCLDTEEVERRAKLS